MASIPTHPNLGVPPTAAASARRRLVAIALASGLLHGALIAAPLLGGPAVSRWDRQATDTSSSIAVRLVSAGTPDTPRVVVTPAEPVVAGKPALPPQAAPVDADAVQPVAAAVGRSPEPGLVSSEAAGLFYPTSALTVRPKALNELDVVFPDSASIIAAGRMVMTLWIDADGQVHDATIESSNLPGLFLTPTIDAFRKLRFEPGQLNGRAVGSVMQIEVSYEDDRMPLSPTVQRAPGQPSS